MLRQDEDWSALRDPELRSNLFDRVKFIPLNHDGSSWLTLGGEARERYEYFDNANWGKGPQDSDGYFLHRFMLHADTHAGENFRFFTQFKSGLESDRNGGPRPTDRDDFDVHQLFADVRVAWADQRSLTLRVGRQELAFGTQRLVSVREGPMCGKVSMGRVQPCDGIASNSTPSPRGLLKRSQACSMTALTRTRNSGDSRFCHRWTAQKLFTCDLILSHAGTMVRLCCC